MEGNSETDGGSQNKMSTKSKDSTGTSVALSRTADKKGEQEREQRLPTTNTQAAEGL